MWEQVADRMSAFAVLLKCPGRFEDRADIRKLSRLDFPDDLVS